MRHFAHLSPAERDRLFAVPPQAVAPHDEPALVGTALGATLYCPATRPQLATDIRRRGAEGVTSLVACLEDAVADHDLAAAEDNLVRQLHSLADGDGDLLPALFVRVRSAGQVTALLDRLGTAARVLTGFVVPKFTEETGPAFLEAVIEGAVPLRRRLLVMPVLESDEFAHAESRIGALLGARRLLDKYRELVPAVRVGATDLSAIYGLRRAPETSVWDVRVVADVLSDVVNVFGRADAPAPYAVSGPVWEYFPASERLFRPQLRLTPFAHSADRALRAELLAGELDGLIREVVLDRANGLTGKSVVHPTHVAPVHALSVVSNEEYADAQQILGTRGTGGATASPFGNKMNESRPHTAWARRTLQRAHVFGVVREDVSFVELLGAVLHQ